MSSTNAAPRMSVITPLTSSVRAVRPVGSFRRTGPERRGGRLRANFNPAGGYSPGLKAPGPGIPADMIGFLAFGLVVGLIARLLLPGRQKIGLLWTLVLGVIGSLIGGTIANALQSGSIWELNFVGFVAAVGASVLVLAIAERTGIGA